MLVTPGNIPSPVNFNEPHSSLLDLNQQIHSLLIDSFQESPRDSIQTRILKLQSEINEFSIAAINEPAQPINLHTKMQSLQQKIDQISTDILLTKIDSVNNELQQLLTSSFGLSKDIQDLQTNLINLQVKTAEMRYLLEIDITNHKLVKKQLNICQQKIHSLQFSTLLGDGQKF